MSNGEPSLSKRRLEQLAWLLPALYLMIVVVRLERAPSPGVVPPDDGARRFGVDRELRKEIYSQLVDKQPPFRERALRFPDAWSRADDYHIQLGSLVVRVAAERRLHQTQVFLIYDEGVREGWSGTGGRKLDGGWPRFVPRIN